MTKMKTTTVVLLCFAMAASPLWRAWRHLTTPAQAQKADRLDEGLSKPYLTPEMFDPQPVEQMKPLDGPPVHTFQQRWEPVQDMIARQLEAAAATERAKIFSEGK